MPCNQDLATTKTSLHDKIDIKPPKQLKTNKPQAQTKRK